MTPEIHVQFLDFDPSQDWVYWCDGCNQFIDVNDIRIHAMEMMRDTHPPVSRLIKHDVIGD